MKLKRHCLMAETRISIAHSFNGYFPLPFKNHDFSPPSSVETGFVNHFISYYKDILPAKNSIGISRHWLSLYRASLGILDVNPPNGVVNNSRINK